MKGAKKMRENLRLEVGMSGVAAKETSHLFDYD